LVNLGISTYTGSQNVINSSVDAHILKQSTQTGSQDLVNLGISTYTGSQNVINSSVDSHILGISIYTASANTTNTSIDAHILAQSIQTASQDLVNYNISIVTSSIDSHILKQATQTGSQDLVNLGISSVTGSLIGITNGLMAFTSALDNTYATDAQLYQLYHATASLNTQTGSQDLVNLSISTYTGSQNVINSSVDAHILKQATQTGSQDLVNLGISSVTGSLIGITNGLMAFTAALDSTYATDAQLYQLYQATASIQFATASLNTQTGSQDIVNFNISVVTSSIDSHILKQATQTGSQDLVNLGISTFTGSLRSEVNGIEAYTASLKGAIEVSGQNVNVLGMITAQQFNVTYVSSSVMYQSGSTKFGDSSDDRHQFTGSLFVSGSTITLKNTGGQSADFVADRPSTSLGATYGYNTAGVNKWYTGLRGLANDNFYIFNNTTSQNTLTLDSSNDSATFYGSVSAKTESDFTGTSVNSRILITATGVANTVIGFNNSGATVTGVINNASYVGNLQAYPLVLTTDSVERVRIASTGDGNVTVSTGNLVIGTAGKGIDFSATSNGSGTTSSELLNDYEEGTWTGTLKGSVSDPTTPVTATGYYTKVGNKVFATIAINNATTTGASGNVSVSGLPFTSAATNNSQGSVMSTFYDFDGGTSLVALLGSSTTNVFIMTSGDDADWNDVLHTVGSGRSLRFSITYFV
jgi:hypothetical protein